MTPHKIADEILKEAKKKNGDLISKIHSLLMEVQMELMEFSDKFRENERKTKSIKKSKGDQKASQV